MPKNTTQHIWPKLKPGPLNPGTSAITMRNEVDVMFIMLIHQLVNFRNLTKENWKKIQS